MTEDNAEARDELRTIIEDLQHEVHQTRDNLDRGPEPGVAADAVDRVERNSQELIRFAEEIQDAVGDLTGGSYSDGVVDLDEGSQAAYDRLDSVLDLLDALDSVVDEMDDGEDADATTRTVLDGAVYEVSFRAVGRDEMEFAERLGTYLNDNDLSPGEFAEEAGPTCTPDRVEALLAGTRQPTEGEREHLAELADGEDDGDSLGELFG